MFFFFSLVGKCLAETLPALERRFGNSSNLLIEGFGIDEYPLVVCLPCHKDHWFDLECIAPWLKLHATCPLDRKNLLEKKEPPPPPPKEEEDGEYDEMFA